MLWRPNTQQTLSDFAGRLWNVRDFGAVGDAVTDDSAAFTACAAAAVAGDTIVIPPGEYYLTTVQDWTGKRLTILADGAKIDWYGGNTGGSDVAITGAAASSATAWVATTTYAVGDVRSNSGNVYIVVAVTGDAKSAGAGGPTIGPNLSTNLAIVDNHVTWQYVGLAASLIQITSTAHGLITGDQVLVQNILGTVVANDLWTVTVMDANTYLLNNSVFAVAYTSGGTGTKVAPVFTFGWGTDSGSLTSAVSDAGRPTYLRGFEIRWRNAGGSGYGVNAMIGIRWQNIYSGSMDNVSARGFGIGLQMIGDGTGCTTSTHRIRQVVDNIIGTHQYARNTAGVNGYVTEQTIIGGDYNWSGTFNTNRNNAGIGRARQIVAEIGPALAQSVAVSSNRWINGCFQAPVSITYYVADIQSGSAYLFDSCRYEAGGAKMPLVLGPNVAQCRITGSTIISPDVSVQDKSNNSGSGGTDIGLPAWYLCRLANLQTTVTVANTTNETSLIGASSISGTFTLPAYFLCRGRTIKLELIGNYSTIATTTQGTLTFKFKVGATTFTVTAFTPPASANQWYWRAMCTFTARAETTLTAATVVGFVEILMQGASTPDVASTGVPNAFPLASFLDTGGNTIDMTASALVDFSAKWSVNDVGNTISCRSALLWTIP